MMTPLWRRFRFVGIACLMIASAAGSAHADEIWVAPTYQQDLGGLGVASNVFWPVTAAGVVRLAWAIPDDLQTFQSAKVAIIPGAAAGGPPALHFYVCAAQNGNSVSANCAGPFVQTFTGVANQLVEVEIGGVLSQHIGAPGSNYLAVLAYTTPATTTDHLVGLRFSYTPKIPTGVPTLAANVFTGTQTAPAFAGDGSALTNVNASRLSGVLASGFAPAAGGASYIQNATSPQSASFNITGNGRAAMIGIGTDPSFGLDVNTDIVAYQDLAFRNGVHRWRLRAPTAGLQFYQIYNQSGTLINQPRLTIADNGDVILGNLIGNGNGAIGGKVGIGTFAAPSAQLQVESAGEGIYAHGITGIGMHARSEQTWAGYFEGYVYFSRGITLTELAGGGGTQLCLNASSQISNCSSSLRYKTSVAPYSGGLNLLSRLRPISFDWKEGGARDIGLAAEEVAQVEPLLTFRNDRGEIEGVKYNQLAAVFINAIQEQQGQIQQQREQVASQQRQIDALERRLNDLLNERENVGVTQH